MKHSEAVTPISKLKAHASEIIRDVWENNRTLVVTHNGEAKVIVQDIKVYEKLQNSLALLKILALSKKSLEDGNTISSKQAFKKIRKQFQQNNK